jgi:hypothetical protein
MEGWLELPLVEVMKPPFEKAGDRDGILDILGIC